MRDLLPEALDTLLAVVAGTLTTAALVHDDRGPVAKAAVMGVVTTALIFISERLRKGGRGGR